MTAAVATKRLQGLGLLAVAAVIFAVAVWSALSPVLDAQQAIKEAEARLQRFNQSAQSGGSRNVDTSMLIAAGEAADTRSLAVQRLLVDDARAAGLQMRQLTAAQPAVLQRDLTRLSYELDVAGDLENWTSFLSQLSTRRPAVFIDKMTLKSGPAARADLNLSIQMTLSAYVLGQGAKR